MMNVVLILIQLFIGIIFCPVSTRAAKIGTDSILEVANGDQDLYMTRVTPWGNFAHMGGTAIGDINGDGIKDFVTSVILEKVAGMELTTYPVSKDSFTESNTVSYWSRTTTANTIPVADTVNYVAGVASISTTRTASGIVNLRIVSGSNFSLNSATDILHFQVYTQNTNERLAYVDFWAPDYNNRFRCNINLLLKSGTWNKIDIPIANFITISGSPSWSSIRNCMINFWGGTSGDIKIDQLYFDYTGTVYKKKGVVYAFLGSISGNKIVTQANISINGIDENDLTGEYIDVKDINGDGLDDIIIGVPYDDGPNNSRQDCGAGYIIFGKNQFPAVIDLNTTADFIIYGKDAGDLFGETVYAADINGDNIKDLIIGAQNAGGYNNAGLYNGEVHIIYGPLNLGGIFDLALANANISIYGKHPYAFLGYQGTIAIGDVYNDGQKDLILGVYGGDKNGQLVGAGKILIINNISNYSGDINLAMDSPTTIIQGADAGDRLCKVTVGDFNHDGIDDIVSGAAGADGLGNSKADAGEVCVFFGSKSLPSFIALSLTEPDIKIIGKDAGDNLGHKVCAGDITRDGIDDIVIAAPGDDGANNAKVNSGAAYVLYGNPARRGIIDLSTTPPELIVYGADNEDNLRDVYCGDYSGDGIDDLILGFREADGINNAYSAVGDLIGINADGIKGFWLNVPVKITSALSFFYPFSPLSSDIKITNLTVVPSGGDINIDIEEWDTSTDRHKRWTEDSVDNITVDYTIGDLKPGIYYMVKIDGKDWYPFVSDSSGKITFTYTGSHSSKIFEVREAAN